MDKLRRCALWLRHGLLELGAEDDPNEPRYDPVQLGAVTLGCMAAIGGLYWLLWTLLVYEGGIFMKLQAAAAVLFTSRTLHDLGYEAAPYAMGPFEGWAGNLIALALCVLLITALARIYGAAARRPRPDA
ncbi:MAG: hypothetical protein WC881_05320 [Elusimicrobiota bacterium]